MIASRSLAVCKRRPAGSKDHVVTFEVFKALDFLLALRLPDRFRDAINQIFSLSSAKYLFLRHECIHLFTQRLWHTCVQSQENINTSAAPNHLLKIDTTARSDLDHFVVTLSRTVLCSAHTPMVQAPARSTARSSCRTDERQCQFSLRNTMVMIS